MIAGQKLKNALEGASARIGAKKYTRARPGKNAANETAETGCTAHQILAITGHETLKVGAAQRELVRRAIDNLENASKTAG